MRGEHCGVPCPTCQQPSYARHTYPGKSGTQRRRKCGNGHVFSTMERVYDRHNVRTPSICVLVHPWNVMSIKLIPGDKVYFIQKGRKLRGIVSDTLSLKTRGEEVLVPISRPRRSSKPATCMADSGHTPREINTRWLPRSKVRKLPSDPGGKAHSRKECSAEESAVELNSTTKSTIYEADRALRKSGQ